MPGKNRALDRRAFQRRSRARRRGRVRPQARPRPARLPGRQRAGGDGRGGRRRHSVRRAHAGRPHPGGLIPAAMAQAPGSPAAPKGPQYLNFPGKSDKLVLLGDRPLVAETPEHLLDDDTTPTDKFFIRNNGPIPEAAKDPDAWKLVGRRRGQQEARAHARRAQVEVPAGDAAPGAGMRRQRPLVLHPAGARQPVDQRRRRLRRVDRRAARRRAQGRRREAVGGVHRPLRRRPQPGRRQQGRALARRADQEGARRQQPHRLRDERPAAAEHPRRSAAADHPGLARLGVVEMAHPHLGARQGARRPRHGRHLVSGRDQADGPGRQARPGQFPRSRIDAGALDHHQPDERHQLRQGRARGEAARRRLGRRPDGAAGRRVDRLSAPPGSRRSCRRRRTPTTGSAGPRP